jgi:hypothetical protein
VIVDRDQKPLHLPSHTKVFATTTLEQVIRDSGVLGTRPPSNDGWRQVKCAVCNDYKFRGGFKFDPSGSCAFHCFNCGFSAVHTPSRSQFSEKMVKVLTSFGIDLSTAQSALFSAFASPSHPQPQKIDRDLIPAKEIEKPSTFFPLDPTKHPKAVEYLKNRGFTENDHQWWISIPADKKWSNRIVVPVYNHREQLVFYQGRTFIDSPKRWESPNVPRSGVIFNHKKLYEPGDSVIVCEGIFDALSVGGVAILGSEFSRYQLSELKKFRGTKIIIPHKDDRGLAQGKSALENGFSLSFPDIGSCGDINEAFVKYGKMYLIQQIYSTIATGPQAEFRLGLWCAG